MKAVSTFVAVASALLGCSRTLPPVATSSVPATPEPRLARFPDESPSRSVIHVSENIRRACGIADADAHFAFDSAVVRGTDYPTLDKLVGCFSTGRLARREMRLIGHADPRGGEEYNMVLGNSRADRVKAFLVDRGLQDRQMATTSRGEMDAKGTDEASWAEDRRVDLLLAD